ncbi:hypothetical protein [Reyranella sp.]|uniref:hypothetical protein n=1 Tax=Reyranella sp. TaxID=1929291 RepID=UPI003D120FE6
MPIEKPVICLPNTPKSSQRSIHCRFEHDGLDASIEVSNVVNPQILPRAGRAYAEGVLLSLAAALTEQSWSATYSPRIYITGPPT